MHIGITAPLPPEPPAVVPDPALLAAEAERLGFESYWHQEHIVSPVMHVGREPNYFPSGHVAGYVDPLISLARASGATSRIKLGTSVIIMPERHPIALAKETATLDLFSGGRLLLGVGTGWLEPEMRIMGGDFARRWAQTRESIEVLKKLWTLTEAEHHGEFYNFPPVRSEPKPLQRPHPPVLLGSTTTERALDRVAQVADGWVPHSVTPEQVAWGKRTLVRLAAAAGRDPARIEISAFVQKADAALARQFRDAGAARLVIIAAHTGSADAALEQYRAIASELL